MGDGTAPIAPSRSIMKVASAHDKKKSKSRIQFKPLNITKSDSSIYPSYTNLALPYRVICRQRYQQCIKDQQKQFIKEIKMHEELQPQALNGVKLHREFCNPILKKVSTKDMIKLTPDEDRRLEHILCTMPKDL